MTIPGSGSLVFSALLVFSLCATPLPANSQPASADQSHAANFDSVARSAAAARESGKTEEAIRTYKQGVAIRPDWAEGWWYLGTLLYDADRYQDASPAFQRLVALAPRFGSAWSFLGLCEYELKDYANALAHLEKGRELGPGDDPEIARVSAYHLGLLQIRNRDFDRGSATLVSTAGQGSTSPKINTALALAMLRVPLLPEELDPSRDALIHAAGEVAADLAKDDVAKALDQFPELLAHYPNIPYLHYVNGLALARAGQTGQAIEQQEKETKISPQSPLPWIQLSSLQLHIRRLGDASRSAEKAVQLAPDSSAAHRIRAESLKALGDEQQSDEEFRLAEKLLPEKPQPDPRIATLYAHASEDAAGKTAVSATGSNTPFNGDARQAAASQATGNTATAIQHCQQGLQQSPSGNESRWSLAMLCYSSGRFPEAISLLKDFVVANPNNGTAWAVMGLSEFEMRDFASALVHLQKGRELGFGGSPDSVQLAYYRLGLLLIHSGQFDAASEVLASGGTGPLVEEVEFARGIALLRMPLFPEQVDPSKRALVEQCGQIAALLNQSRYDAAFAKFKQLLDGYPTVPFLHYSYGTALIALSQYDEAREQMLKETQLSPASPLPHLRLASIALRQHRPADAVSPAEQALRLAPASAEGHYLLGRANLELGHAGIAVAELQKASALAPGSAEVHYNLAKAYAKAGMPEQAEQERATFVRQDALAEEQRRHDQNRAYSGPREAGDFSTAGTTPPAVPNPR
jgi:tetratricopeptide (TPR) repeat protein